MEETHSQKRVSSVILFWLFIFFQNSLFAQSTKDSIVILNNNSYSLTSGNVTFAVNPESGGRIISFKLSNYEFLTDKNINPFNYGSTFWPSPQSNWNWPPPAVLDNEPYSAIASSRSIKLISGKDSTTGFQFEKVFSSGKNNSIKLNYSIINISNKTKSAAPWEVTRVHKGGLFFFPIGKGLPGKKQFEAAPIKIINGIVWYKSKKEKIDKDELSIADGSEGWMAYAINGKLFIKKFDDTDPSNFAPGEAEISLYVNAKSDYIEIELQGKYQNIEPREKTDLNVEWIAKEIPSNIKAEKGNMKLVEFVRHILK